MITIRDVKKSFDRGPVLRGVSAVLPQGISAVIGPSGSGKSVLLKCISGTLPFDSGSIELDPSGILPGLMFQEGALFDSLSVFDNVAFPLVDGRVPAERLPPSERSQVEVAVSAALAHVGLSRAAWRNPAELSGGMKRRASLARALVARSPIVMLDDPTAGLDPVASSVIMELIVQHHRSVGGTTVIVSHDLRRLFPVVENVLALSDGKAIFSGTVDELFSGNAAPAALREFISCRYSSTDYQNDKERISKQPTTALGTRSGDE